MSLPVAERGANAHLRYLWEADEFDFFAACRAEGRNNAVWVHCYRLHLAGEGMPDERERNRLIREANLATGGLNQDSERERYARYEAQQTIEQVKGYREASEGVTALTANYRRWVERTRRPVSPDAKRLLLLLCDVAERRLKWRFYASHRDMARGIGVDRCQISGLLNELRRHGKDLRDGETKPWGGRKRGTTIISLRPPEPAQRIDEEKRPTFSYRKARWTWKTPLEKGQLSIARCRWLARQGLAAASAAGVPYVLFLSLRGERIYTNKRTNSVFNGPTTRGSPLLEDDLDEKTTSTGHADIPSGLSV